MEYAKRRPLAVVLVAAAMAATAGPAVAEELQVRSGVVTSILAVEAPPPAPSAIDARQSRELGGLLGRAVGQATGSDVATAHLLGRLAADVVGSAGRDRNGAGSPGGYTVVVRFDDATEAGFTKARDHLDRIRVGTRVRVVGAGSLASLVPEQGGSGAAR